MLEYLSLDIICSSKLTIFLELHSRKTFCSSKTDNVRGQHGALFCTKWYPDPRGFFLEFSPHERAARESRSRARSGEHETRSGEKEKLLVTLDLNLTFMPTPGSGSDPRARIGWYFYKHANQYQEKNLFANVDDHHLLKEAHALLFRSPEAFLQNVTWRYLLRNMFNKQNLCDRCGWKHSRKHAHWHRLSGSKDTTLHHPSGNISSW